MPSKPRSALPAVLVIAALSLLAGSWYLWTITDEIARDNVANLMLWSGQDRYVYVAQPTGTSYTPSDMTGQFHAYQLFTYALVDRDAIDLGINLLFFLVLGVGIASLLGNATFVAIYLIPVVIAGLANHIALANAPPLALCGPATATLGLAGLCLVACPLRPMRLRMPRPDFEGAFTLLQARALTVAILCLAFNDFLPMLLRTGAYVPFTAHLTALIAGALTGLVILAAGLTDTQGDDLPTLLKNRQPKGHALPR